MSESLKKKILIVEDEKPLSHALQMKLEKAGFETIIATNGEEALQIMGTNVPDLILLDLVMPKLDGFGFLAEIKKRQINIPIFVLSNLEQEEDKQRVMEQGAKSYMVKSNTPLANIVERIIQELSTPYAP